MHRDDSDDDSDDEFIDDSSEGWEDELGAERFPEENRRSSETEEEIDVDYWTDDDAEELEEERERYFITSQPREALVAAERALRAIRLGSLSRSSSSEGAPAPAACEDPCTSSKEPPASSVAISCPLCLEAPMEASATRCGHLFCTP